MIPQTRILLSLWDPGLVEEALNFIEENKITKFSSAEEPERAEVSTFKKLAQQISMTTKRTEYDELMTPDDTQAQQNLWSLLPASRLNGCDLNSPDNEKSFFIIPPGAVSDGDKKPVDENSNMADEKSNMDVHSDTDEKGETNKKFLDTHAMCSSPSANYYKPTDEPEPWDLTQLNIEASVLCLVSKVKFLCGKCGSPAVRLRPQKTISRSQNSFKKDNRRQVSGFVCSGQKKTDGCF